jgi:hypothetical protein
VGTRGQREVGVHRLDPLVGPGDRHHLPDRLQDVGRRPQLERPAHEACRQVDLPHPRRDRRVDIDHRFAGDARGHADTGQLVGRLDDLRRSDDRCGVRRRLVAEQSLLAPAHRTGQLIDRDHGTAGGQIGQSRGKRLHTLVELQIDRAVHMVGRQARVGGQTLAEGHEQVRPLVIG